MYANTYMYINYGHIIPYLQCNKIYFLGLAQIHLAVRPAQNLYEAKYSLYLLCKYNLLCKYYIYYIYNT